MIEYVVSLGEDDMRSEHVKLKECLKRLGLYGEEFCYAAVPAEQLKRVRKKGTASKAKPTAVYVYDICLSYDESEHWIGDRHGDDHILNHLRDYVDQLGFASLVVYHASALTHETGACPALFKDPKRSAQAVAAIVHIGGIDEDPLV